MDNHVRAGHLLPLDCLIILYPLSPGNSSITCNEWNGFLTAPTHSSFVILNSSSLLLFVLPNINNSLFILDHQQLPLKSYLIFQKKVFLATDFKQVWWTFVMYSVPLFLSRVRRSLLGLPPASRTFSHSLKNLGTNMGKMGEEKDRR